MEGYYFYLAEEENMFISNRTVFLEREFFSEEIDGTKIELDEVREVKKLVHTESDLVEESNLEPVKVPLRRFDRVPHQLERYYGFLN